MAKEKYEYKEVDNVSGSVDTGTIETNETEGKTIITIGVTNDDKSITVSTIENRIDDYFDEKRVLIAEKIGLAIDNVDEDAGNAIMAYLMSGQMMRSGLALLCYEASGGDGNDADDVAAIIEAVSTAYTARDEILAHDYANDINEGIKNIADTPWAILRGDMGFLENAFNAIVGSPKAVVDGIDLAKAAVGDTIAEITRGDYARDSAYITYIKAGNALAMSIACRAGSEKAGNEECVELCYLYGRNLGVAYAIAEDVCKIVDCAELGTLNEDTGLAMAYALDQCGANALIGDIDGKALFKELRKGDNIEDAKLRMMIAYNKYAKAAINAARRLPDGIQRDMLIALPNYLFVSLKEDYGIDEVF